MKYRILKDVITLIFEEENVMVNISHQNFIRIATRLKQAQLSPSNSYTEKCFRCGLLDYVNQGYCKRCFDKLGMSYEMD